MKLPQVLATVAVTAGLAATAACGGTPDPTRPSAVRLWGAQGGAGYADTLRTDRSTINADLLAPGTGWLIEECVKMGVDVVAAKAFAPVPDPEMQGLWADYLHHLGDASSECVLSLETFSIPQARAADRDLTAADRDATALNALLHKRGVA